MYQIHSAKIKTSLYLVQPWRLSLQFLKLNRIQVAFLGLAVLLFSFQNCSSGFEAMNSSSSLGYSNINQGVNTAECTPQATGAPAKLSQTCFGKLTPTLTSQTGSYTNYFQYEPQYPLYSDGASKRRWVYLPPGQTINTSDPDNWIFPKGTIFYKEFSLGGQKIETRQIEKLTDANGPTAWRFSTYAWTTDQADAELAIGGFYSQSPDQLARFSAASVQSVYKIPSTTTCLACHDGAVDVVNGFNYLQLSSRATQFNLSQASRAHFFSLPPAFPDQIPGTDLDKKVVGYIQSNCAICHGGIGPGTGDFKHSSLSQKLADEPLMTTAATLNLITKGNPDASLLYIKFSTGLMPQVHPITPDAQGIADMRSCLAFMKLRVQFRPSTIPS